MMDVLTFETCCALNNEIIKQVTSSWSIFIQLYVFIYLFLDFHSSTHYYLYPQDQPKSHSCRDGKFHPNPTRLTPTLTYAVNTFTYACFYQIINHTKQAAFTRYHGD